MPQRLTPEQRQIASEIVEELENRLESLLNVGLIDLGPGAGALGGEVVAAGTIEHNLDVIKTADWIVDMGPEGGDAGGGGAGSGELHRVVFKTSGEISSDWVLTFPLLEGV